MIYGGLSQFILSRGGADGFLYNGPKETSKIQIEVEIEPQKGSSVSYHVDLIPTVTDSFLLENHRTGIFTTNDNCNNQHRNGKNEQSNAGENDIYKSLKKFQVHMYYPCFLNIRICV